MCIQNEEETYSSIISSSETHTVFQVDISTEWIENGSGNCEGYSLKIEKKIPQPSGWCIETENWM